MRAMLITGMLFSIMVPDLMADQNENIRAVRPDALSYPGSTPEIVSPFDSAQLEQIQQCICQLKTVIESGFDVVASQLDIVVEIDETILSKVSKIDSDLDILESSIDELFACASTPITAAETILLPGIYCFANNITGDITINSSNVILDLNGFQLTGGIIILQPSVTVQNGAIDGNTATGISFSSTLSSIIIKDMIITNCSYGIHSIYTSGTPASGLIISDVFVDNGGSGAAGCQIDNRVNVIVRDSTFVGSAYGLFLEVGVISGCENVEISNCEFNNNLAAGYNDHVLPPIVHKNIQIINCSAHQNLGHGFSVSSDGETVIGCQATNNTASGFTIGGNSGGNALVDVILIDCLAVNNDQGFTVSSGCTIDIQGCLAFDNNTDGFSVNSGGVISCQGTLSLCKAVQNGGCGFTDTHPATLVNYVSNFATLNVVNNYCIPSGSPYNPVLVTDSLATYWRNVYL